ncbi:MAG TPA: DUF2007 domain-containing protein [Sedimentisphaerales bacterium]|nr:DUF2007 domain-containing protein [Sedimentisphaerales bacterium]
MSEKIVTIAKFDDVMEAELAVQRLADYDIRAILNGKNFAGMYAGLGVDLFNVGLQVLESDADKAIEILGSIKSDESNESDDIFEDDDDGSDD